MAVNNKIKSYNLERLAAVYARQSRAQQVLNHQESTSLQYNLREKAIAWGWSSERVLVIDEDQAQSGSSAAGHTGFQRLLVEVGLNHVGLILGVGMSRLARSCKDWYHLLEICAVFQTVFADQGGLYDPRQYNDRLLLGLIRRLLRDSRRQRPARARREAPGEWRQSRRHKWANDLLK